MSALPGVEINVQGEDTGGGDPLEAVVTVAGVPRAGEQLGVWDGNSEVYCEVALVTWSTWQYDHDPGVQMPTVSVRREGGYSDEEWRDFFAAMKEGRSP